MAIPERVWGCFPLGKGFLGIFPLPWEGKAATGREEEPLEEAEVSQHSRSCDLGLFFDPSLSGREILQGNPFIPTLPHPDDLRAPAG